MGSRTRWWLAGGGALLVVLAVVASLLASGGDDGPDAETAADTRGQAAYNTTCAACHGADLKGTSTGPPFLNNIYAPNHHSDDSFRLAVLRGVQPHHWNFGAMPAQPQVSKDDVEAIIDYVRARQQEAGITNDPSH